MDFLKEEYFDKTALLIQQQMISYRQLNSLVEQMALKMLKLPQGVIVLTAKQNLSFIIKLLAAFKNHQPVLLLSASLTEQERLQKILPVKYAVQIDDEANFITVNQDKAAIEVAPLARLILYTSGSSGDAKAVQLSIENILANCHAVIKSLDFETAQTQLLHLPLCYSFGLLGQLLPALICGMTTRLAGDFSEVISLLVAEQVQQMWSGVPSHWHGLLQIFKNFPSAALKLSHVISAGAPLDLSLRKQLQQQFKNATIYNNYGLTEASPRVLSMKSTHANFFSDKVGKLVGDFKARLTEDGELCLKGAQVMLGYLGDIQNNKVQDGWLYTGDLAQIDSDGIISIIGRKDRVIKIAGEKVSLVEIDHRLSKTEFDVVTIDCPDKLQGSHLVLCLATKLKKMARAQLYQILHQALQPWHHGFELFFIDDLPLNSRGKLDKAKLRLLIRKNKNV